ncbi:ATP-binding protein [Streptomyces platensis]|nr:ATP-binding protein [Streptomyces platensis]
MISKRYEKGSIILTSNKTFSEWGQVFGDEFLATAILDPLLHHCDVIPINGNSYRLKNRFQAVERDTAWPEDWWADLRTWWRTQTSMGTGIDPVALIRLRTARAAAARLPGCRLPRRAVAYPRPAPVAATCLLSFTKNVPLASRS